MPTPPRSKARPPSSPTFIPSARATSPGLGVTTSAMDTDFSQGATVSTGNPLDAAIQGNGYFVVDQNGPQEYTRDGSFELNSAGELVSASTGAAVMGIHQRRARPDHRQYRRDAGGGHHQLDSGVQSEFQRPTATGRPTLSRLPPPPATPKPIPSRSMIRSATPTRWICISCRYNWHPDEYTVYARAGDRRTAPPATPALRRCWRRWTSPPTARSNPPTGYGFTADTGTAGVNQTGNDGATLNVTLGQWRRTFGHQLQLHRHDPRRAELRGRLRHHRRLPPRQL